MAPNHLLLRVVNLSRMAGMVRDLNGLIELRDAYLKWIEEAKKAVMESVEEESRKLVFLRADPVETDYLQFGGVGSKFNSLRAKGFLDLVKATIQERIEEISSYSLDDGILSYDPETKFLYIRGVNIQITDRAESRQCSLLKTLFSNPQKVWSTDEIIEDWEGNEKYRDRVSSRAPYQAAIRVNSIVAKETDIDDFLIADTKEIRINTKYLHL